MQSVGDVQHHPPRSGFQTLLNTEQYRWSEGGTGGGTEGQVPVWQTRPEPTRAEQTRPEPTRAEQTRPEATRAEQTRPEATRAEQTRPEPNRAEQTGQETSTTEQVPSRAEQRSLAETGT